MLKVSLRLSMLVLSISQLLACAGKPDIPDVEPVQRDVDKKPQNVQPVVSGTTQDRKMAKVIYFSYNSAEIEPAYEKALREHIEYVSENPEASLRIEGHTDERGSREYNLALGLRRAYAIERALVLGGIPKEKIQSLSYGEERPSVEGNSEEFWKLNRRVTFDYE